MKKVITPFTDVGKKKKKRKILEEFKAIKWQWQGPNSKPSLISANVHPLLLYMTHCGSLKCGSSSTSLTEMVRESREITYVNHKVLYKNLSEHYYTENRALKSREQARMH